MKHNPILPTDSAMRKESPICTGVLRYFPRAAAYVARISVLGNEKHNPGEPLHWAEGKSMDHPDCIVRHVIEAEEFDPDDGALHAGKLAWRAWANLETMLKQREREGLPIWDEEIIAANRAKQKAASGERRNLSADLMRGRTIPSPIEQVMPTAKCERDPKSDVGDALMSSGLDSPTKKSVRMPD